MTERPRRMEQRSGKAAPQGAGLTGRTLGPALALLACFVPVMRHSLASEPPRRDERVLRCQALGPAAPYPIAGLDSAAARCGELDWQAAGPINWQKYAQGEYVGHERLAHVPEYRLRVGDELDVVFRMSRDELPRPYRLNVGDEVRVESFTDEMLNQDLTIQPDGTIMLRLLNQVYAARTTVAQLQNEIERRYKKYYREPAINVMPLKVNSKLEDMRSSVDLRYGYGGQSRHAKVTPEGTIQLPGIGSIPVQGLSLDEVRTELEERYATRIAALDVTPVLVTRARRYVYVLGEVRAPGRYELDGPTTVMQSISMAGGWIHGGNVWNTVVFRRGDDWRLMATRLDLRGPLYSRRPCPADEIWINDSDIVLVPKSRVLVAQNVIDLVFKQGLFKVVPFRLNTSYSTFRIIGLVPKVPITSGLPTPPTHIPGPTPH